MHGLTRATPAALAHGLRLRRLTKTYGPLRAVDDVSLDVAAGEFLTLLGPSGSGKTTLLMMIAGFTTPSSGEILVDDRDVTSTPPEHRNFGVVFQGYALFPHMTAAENVAYPLRVRGIRGDRLRDKVRQALALVRLDGLGERLPRELSGGQQQRVAIARALVFSPDLLLLDEPLGALDRQLRAEVQAELKALHADLGATFVYITHDQDEALSMSDRVAIVHQGRIEQVAAPATLYERPRTRFVAEFLGRSNIILQGGTPHALRPEKIMLSHSEPSLPHRVPGHVARSFYLGAMLHVDVETAPLGRLSAACLAWSAPALAVGDAVWLGWHDDAASLLDEPS